MLIRAVHLLETSLVSFQDANENNCGGAIQKAISDQMLSQGEAECIFSHAFPSAKLHERACDS